jgi:hypothetical protein
MKKKFISGLLLITVAGLSLGGVFLAPKKVQATVPTNDAVGIATKIARSILEIAKMGWQTVQEDLSRWAVKFADWAWQEALSLILAIVKKQILDMLVNEVIVWIQGGDGGEPKFITNWWNFLDQAVNEAEYKFSRQLSQSNICDSFKSTIIKSLEPSGSYDGLSGFVGKLDQSFNQKINCTFQEQTGASFENFFNDFRNGGWKGWLSITEPQNNFYGAYLMAMDEKMGLINRAKEAAQNKGIANSGWLGDERCVACSLYDGNNNKTGSAAGVEACEALSNEIPPGGSWQCDKKDTFTPGDTLGKLAGEALTKDMDWVLEITSEPQLAAYLAAIANALINRTISEGLSIAQGINSGPAPQTMPSGLDPSILPPALTPPAIIIEIGSIDIIDLTGQSINSLALAVGDSISLTAVVKDPSGAGMPNLTVESGSWDGNITISSPRFIKTNGRGEAAFTVIGLETGSTVITFAAGLEPNRKSQNINVTVVPADTTPTDPNPIPST